MNPPNNPPKKICICNARTENQCLCGAWTLEPTDYNTVEELRAGFDGDDGDDDGYESDE